MTFTLYAHGRHQLDEQTREKQPSYSASCLSGIKKKKSDVAFWKNVSKGCHLTLPQNFETLSWLLCTRSSPKALTLPLWAIN